MNPVLEHQWKKRVIIVSASSPNHIGYREQQALLTHNKKGMKERDLIIYRLYNDHWLDSKGQLLSQSEANEIRKAYQIPVDEFMVLLIGKDGNVKMRKNDPVETRHIFSLIDSMPMRKQEIKYN